MKQYAHTVINFRTFIFEFVDPFTDDVTDCKYRKKSFRIRKKTCWKPVSHCIPRFTRINVRTASMIM